MEALSDGCTRPIPEGADECPECGEPFAFLPAHKRHRKAPNPERRTISLTETTTLGGITGVTTAHPGAPAAVLAVGAVVWFLRAGGVLTDIDEPLGTYAVLAADLVAAMLLVLSLGPARLVAQLAALGQFFAAVYLAEGNYASPRHLPFITHAAFTFVALVGEPGPVRRALSVALGVAAGIAAGIGLFLGNGAASAGTVELTDGSGRFRLRAPEGYRAMSRDEMVPHLHLPLPGGTARHFGFGNRARRVYGALTIDDGPSSQLVGGCQEHLRVLGGVNAPVPLPVRPPAAFQSGLVFELRTASGAVGRLSCGQLSDGRVAALAVVAQGEGGDGEAVFEQIAAGLRIGRGQK